jgi:hypothetical protein
METQELYWLAGIIEGEGTFSYPGYCRIKVKMTDEDVVNRCQAVCEVGNVSGPHFDRHNPTYKPSWQWSVSDNRDAAALMMTLLPLMGNRRADKIRECLAQWHADDHPGTGVLNRSKTECPRGHFYDEENTRIYKGKRNCRQCAVISSRAYEARQKAVA